MYLINMKLSYIIVALAMLANLNTACSHKSQASALHQEAAQNPDSLIAQTPNEIHCRLFEINSKPYKHLFKCDDDKTQFFINVNDFPDISITIYPFINQPSSVSLFESGLKVVVGDSTNMILGNDITKLGETTARALLLFDEEKRETESETELETDINEELDPNDGIDIEESDSGNYELQDSTTIEKGTDITKTDSLENADIITADTLAAIDQGYQVSDTLSTKHVDQVDSVMQADSLLYHYIKLSYTSYLSFPDSTANVVINIDDREFQMDVVYPRVIIEDLFIEDQLEKVRLFPDSLAFQATLTILDGAYQQLQADPFMDKSKKLAQNWANVLANDNKNPLEMIDFLGKLLLADIDRVWFFNFRETKLSGYVDYLEAEGKEKNKVAELYATLFEWTDNISYRVKELDTLAEAAIHESRYWDAIDHWHTIHNLEYVPNNRRSEITEALRNGTRLDSRNNTYSNIYSYGRRFASLFSNDFELRYRFSRAADANNDFPVLIRELEWLLNNFSERQNLVARNALLLELNKAYQSGMEFDKAIATNRRIYLQDRDYEILDMFVVNLRARMVNPIIRVLDRFNNNRAFSSALTNLNEDIVFYHDIYLDAISLVNSSGRVIENIFESATQVYNQVNVPKTDFTRFHFDQVTEKSFFSIPWQNSHILFQIDNRLNVKESNQIKEIHNNPENISNWNVFIRENERNGAIISATVTAALLENAMIRNSDFSLSEFNRALCADPSLVFCYINISGKGQDEYKSTGLTDAAVREMKDTGDADIIFHTEISDANGRYLTVFNSILNNGVRIGELIISYYLID